MHAADTRQHPGAAPRYAAASGMKKARSVDFGSLRARYSSERGDHTGASQFSRRAARGSYKALNLYPSLKESGSQEEEAAGAIVTSATWRRRRSDAALSDADSAYSAATDGSDDTAGSLQLRIPLAASWTVGRLSVGILLVALLAGGGADVLRPGLRYETGAGGAAALGAKHHKPRASLGSAAIASVTESLAPILPFTGGLDLRREDYWATSGTWYEKLQAVAAQVQDAFSPQPSGVALAGDDALRRQSASRGGGDASAGAPAPTAAAKRKPVVHVPAISAPQPFVTVDEIAELTLSDVSETFRYAVEANRPGFPESKFVGGLSARVRKVVRHMTEAVDRSRGTDVKLSVADTTAYGQVDALLFCAAMRIFAEWRVVRQVPEGYKGFAVGMSLGHKDIVQNVAKIESTVHAFLNQRRDMLALEAQWEGNGADENCPIDGSQPRCLRSPTLREVMQYERDMGINPSSSLPRLKDKSGSMGILWTRRQLHYQTLLLDNVLKVPTRYASTAGAVLAAYREVYDRYHGWAVQKIFNYSFQSAPEAEEIFKHMNPHRLSEATQEARRLLGGAAGGASPGQSPGPDDGNIFAALVHHVGTEWDKLVAHTIRAFDKNHGAGHADPRGAAADDADAAAVNEYIVQAMVKDAYERIPAYLQIVYPLLDDLAVTFDRLNMDDPTKV